MAKVLIFRFVNVVVVWHFEENDSSKMGYEIGNRITKNVKKIQETEEES